MSKEILNPDFQNKKYEDKITEKIPADN